jgi:PTS system ascorbate-specific IIA component
MYHSQPIINVNSVSLDYEVENFADAVLRSTELLVLGGYANENYAQRVYDTAVKELQYGVLTDNSVLLHDRPSADALHTGLSLLRVKEPIELPGKSENNVRLFISISATNTARHLMAIASIANVLANYHLAQQLLTASDSNAIVKALLEYHKTNCVFICGNDRLVGN